MITLYSTGCPQCEVLKTKLQQLDIKYQLVEGDDAAAEIAALGYQVAPILKHDDEICTFIEAIKWLREVG